MRWFNKRYEKRSADMPDKVKDFLLGEDVGFDRSRPVTAESAMTLSAVYACVRIISETIASLPLNVYERVQRDGRWGKRKAHEHPLNQLLHDIPNNEMTSFVFREVLMSSLLLYGNAYAQIVRSGGRITDLYPLLPNRMSVSRDAVTNRLIYDYSSDKGSYRLSPDEVLHVPGLSYDGIIGLSPIRQASGAISLALATEEFGARFFENGARPGGILEHPGLVKDPEKLRKSWESVYKGVKNSNRVCVLEEGMKYHEIGIPPEEAQFLETRKFQTTEVCRIFRVPPHMVADLEKATFSNIEHQSIEFVEHTIRPWIVRLEQSMLRALFSESERTKYFAQFNVDGLLRGAFTERMNGYAIGRQNGWLSANDIRELEDMDPIPAEKGGDEYLVNGGMMNASAAQAVKKETEQPELTEKPEESEQSEQPEKPDEADKPPDIVPKKHTRNVFSR